MLTALWRSLTLRDLAVHQWQDSSYLTRWVGWLHSWQRGSVLLPWGNELGVGLLSLLFVLAPFSTTSLIGYLLLAVAGLWLLLMVAERWHAWLTPIHVPVLLYWGISTIATAFSPVRAAAFEGWVKLTLYISLFAMMAQVLRSPRWRSWLIGVYLLTALVVSTYGLRQWFVGVDALATWVDPESPLAQTTRVYSYLGNPNLLAAYLVPAVAFSIAAIGVWQRWTLKLLALTMTIVNITCLLLTFSRGGWIGMVVVLGVLTLLFAYWRSWSLPLFWRTWAIPIALAVMVSVILAAVVIVDPLRDRVVSMFQGRQDSSNNFRINVWLAVIEMIRDHPLLGIGPGNDAFKKVYPLYAQARFAALSAYSIFLEVLVETGVLGLVGFLWLLLVTFNQAWRQVEELRVRAHPELPWLFATIATMLGMLAHGLVDTVWYRPQVAMLWWLTIALIACYSRLLGPPASQTDPSHHAIQADLALD
ncbi:IctB family putative bicarbonate transporter [Trichothermofontia sichuanensis B231]|uniref:IctB family putative bicarbonate transporter n=1 Tax=Trichothermofontia sichuanensis TaxID=3045816 RepID=UPI0022479AE0|nr:IctB family putative bicarbonate transporter [Trichothermofontia sichuanensis B231]